jgi:hypothetical protein
VASSLKQTSEMWLAEREGGGTELRMKVKVDVLGRMGTFGLGVMKTKADRMWDEFGVNAAARLAPPAAEPMATPATAPLPAAAAAPAAAPVVTAAATTAAAPQAPMAPSLPVSVPAVARTAAPAGFWARLFGGAPPLAGQEIRVELRRGDTVLTVHWPAQASQECAAWLRTLV